MRVGHAHDGLQDTIALAACLYLGGRSIPSIPIQLEMIGWPQTVPRHAHGDGLHAVQRAAVYPGLAAERLWCAASRSPLSVPT